jgi:two-component system LytT family response regulator
MHQRRAFHVSSLRLLIVDDEPLIRQGIRSGLSAVEGVEIVGECGSGSHATETILAKDPDIVLLDVQMPDCTGLDVVRMVGPQRMPAVVFITAYDEYAVAAFELNAVDYILKPFDDDRLRAAIVRARQRISGNRQAVLVQQLQSLLETKHHRWPERLVVREGDRLEFVPVDTIDWIESANNYVVLHCGPKQHVLTETLTNLDKRLNPEKFLRVHRCRIVNISRVIGARPWLSGTYQLELQNGTRLGSGRVYHDAVRRLIRN